MHITLHNTEAVDFPENLMKLNNMIVKPFASLFYSGILFLC